MGRLQLELLERELDSELLQGTCKCQQMPANASKCQQMPANAIIFNPARHPPSKSLPARTLDHAMAP
jgi:hypothetical protein